MPLAARSVSQHQSVAYLTASQPAMMPLAPRRRCHSTLLLAETSEFMYTKKVLASGDPRPLPRSLKSKYATGPPALTLIRLNNKNLRTYLSIMPIVNPNCPYSRDGKNLSF